MAQPTQTFGPWLKQKLVEAGEISPDAQGVNLDPKVRDAYLRMWQNESKVSNFQPTAVAVTNPVNTNQVVPMIMTSPGSAIPFPQPSFKEGKVDDAGTPLVFDDTTGMYFPATNKATRAPVKPQANEQVTFVPGPNGTLIPVMPGMAPTNTPTATPNPASVAPAQAGTFETNMPTMPATTLSSAMGPSASMSMTPTAAPAPAAPAPASPRVFTRAQYKQMTGQDLAPGQYENAKGQPFDIVP